MKWLALCITAFFFQACGYGLQGTKNPLQDLGIKRIFVESFRNETYRPGVEQLFTTAMIREIEKSGHFEIVSNAKNADAILVGTVVSAASSIGSTKSVTVDTKEFQIASEYNASIGVSILLRDPRGRVIFSQQVSGSKAYPGATQTGDAGATVSLVNDSEQRIAYHFLAAQLMSSVYQRMVDIF